MLHLEYFSEGSLSNNLKHEKVLQLGSSGTLLLIFRRGHSHTSIVCALHGHLDLLLLFIVRVLLPIIISKLFELRLQLRLFLLFSFTEHFIQILCGDLPWRQLLRSLLRDQILNVVAEVFGWELVDLLLLVFLSSRVPTQILLLNVVYRQVLLHLETEQTFQEFNHELAPNHHGKIRWLVKWNNKNYLLLQVALKAIVVFLLKVDGKLRLLAKHASRDSVEVGDRHLAHRLLFVEVKYLVLRDYQGTSL